MIFFTDISVDLISVLSHSISLYFIQHLFCIIIFSFLHFKFDHLDKSLGMILFNFINHYCFYSFVSDHNLCPFISRIIIIRYILLIENIFFIQQEFLIFLIKLIITIFLLFIFKSSYVIMHLILLAFIIFFFHYFWFK